MVFMELKQDGMWVTSDPLYDGYWTLNGERAALYDLSHEYHFGNRENIGWVGREGPPLDVLGEANYKLSEFETVNIFGKGLKQFKKTCVVHIVNDVTPPYLRSNVLAGLAMYVLPMLATALGSAIVILHLQSRRRPRVSLANAHP